MATSDATAVRSTYDDAGVPRARRLSRGWQGTAMDATARRALQEAWDRAAMVDPLFTICSDASRTNGRWDHDAFFKSGDAEVDGLLSYISSRGVAVPVGAALDFGCGVGRLSRALAARFHSVVGLDLSTGMVRQAQHMHVGCTNLEFRVNDRADLRCFGDQAFAFVYSNIVLQHIPGPDSLSYVSEFVRVLDPRGLAVFSVPDDWRLSLMQHMPGLARGLRRVLRRPAVASGGTVEWQLHSLPEEVIRQCVRRAGGEILDVTTTNAARPGFNGELQFDVPWSWRFWRMKQYCVRRSGGRGA